MSDIAASAEYRRLGELVDPNAFHAHPYGMGLRTNIRLEPWVEPALYAGMPLVWLLGATLWLLCVRLLHTRRERLQTLPAQPPDAVSATA